jgi:DinB superfamily
MLSPDERAALIRQYAAGPARLKAALATVPAAAMQWRPAPGEWSAHEIIVHCGDAEVSGAARIRFLIAERDPLIVGYDEAAWATALDYHALPLEPALASAEAARLNTVPLLERLPDDAWQRAGRHSASGRYTAEDWLRIYGVHLEEHAQQIEANVAAWETRLR